MPCANDIKKYRPNVAFTQYASLFEHMQIVI